MNRLKANNAYFISFLKNNYKTLAVCLVAIIICYNINNMVIDSVIERQTEESEQDIEERMRSLFFEQGETKDIIQNNDNYTIVISKKEEKPTVNQYLKSKAYLRFPGIQQAMGKITPKMIEEKIDLDDTLSYNQIYSNIKTYYSVKSGWSIEEYSFDEHCIIKTTIRPIALGVNSYDSIDIDNAFRLLYNNIINDESKVHRKNIDVIISDIESDLHKIEYENSFGCDSLWIDYNFGKIFIEHNYDLYRIASSWDLISERKSHYNLLAYLSEILLGFLIFKVIKRAKNKDNSGAKRNQSKIIKSLSRYLKPSKEKVAPQKHILYDVLIQKINPINFMHPYDAEKVKLANDLYSVLINSEDNETIIKMIYEKAKKDLEIDL